MFSFDMRRKPSVTAGMLAVVLTPFVAASQPVFEPVANDERQRAIAEQIQRIQAQDGLNSPDLIDLLRALGLLYQESGDDALAAAAAEYALHVVRVNYGVYSLDQAPLIRQLIDGEEARGDDEGAWEREQALLTLVRRHPDDLRAVPILREIADRRMDVLDRYLAGEQPPQIALGCYYDWSRNDAIGNCRSGSRRDAVRTLVLDAQRNFADAIAVILRNELYSSGELRELEMELVRRSDLIRYRNDLDAHLDLDLVLPPRIVRSTEPWRSAVDALLLLADWDLPDSPDVPAVERGWVGGSDTEVFRIDDLDNPYRLGRLALQRSFDYEAAASAPRLSRVAALVAIADWDLLYARNALAIEEYESAYRMLEEPAEARASIDGIFAPEVPVMLPTFLPNPLISDDTQESTGYIDVAFEITKYGEGRRIEILDATASATDADEDRLVRLIGRNRFRPRVTDGEFVRTPPIAVRYYLYD